MPVFANGEERRLDTDQSPQGPALSPSLIGCHEHAAGINRKRRGGRHFGGVEVDFVKTPHGFESRHCKSSIVLPQFNIYGSLTNVPLS